MRLTRTVSGLDGVEFGVGSAETCRYAGVIPGYSYVDITSATTRPDGTPEPDSDHLTDCLIEHTTGTWQPTPGEIG
ncbi:hypothetical protein AB0N05_11700 [Nocardia sp. NPDC051030]|uniref:hypothetical protein n=1 Tax=Nocardia sp. NPDC051030 TaxID=3155162 RepID=UPI00343B598B